MRRARARLSLLGVALALCCGCGSGGDAVENPAAIPAPETPSIAQPQVRLFNAVPYAGTLSVSVTERPAVADPSAGETSRLLHKVGFGDLTARDTIQAGRPTFTEVDSASGETLALQVFTLLRGMSYTLALVGQLPENPSTPTITGVSMLLIPDDVTGPPYGRGRLRFLAGLPSTKTYDVYIIRPGADIQAASPTFSGLLFKQYTGYLYLPVDTYRVIVTEAAAKNAVVAEYRAPLPDGGFLAALPLHSRESSTLALVPGSTDASAPARIVLLPDHN